MPKISAVGLFCCDKFEKTPKQKVIDLSKLTKSYFRKGSYKKLEFVLHLGKRVISYSKSFDAKVMINISKLLYKGSKNNLISAGGCHNYDHNLNTLRPMLDRKILSTVQVV